MFSSSAKMSLEGSDVQTDEDCEELGEDGFSFPADISEKRTERKKPSGKSAPSPKSPYLSSLNVNPRRAAMGAWRLPKASTQRDSRGDTPGETGSARISSLLSNGHDVTLRSECEVTPELLKQNLSMKKFRHLHSASNGFTLGACDYREKEDMYDEIIRLKKSLQAQKSDNHQMKVKLRRLEEDNAKREKQIEELLDPTKGSEYTRSLVDKKKEGSVVLNGLKQRILKLEQQCREKENALSKLQSELRTTNLEELKITVETYFQEIQRLRILLEAAEKSSRAESKCSQRQQKALSSTVRRLSENLKQLQQENAVLREEVNTDCPAGGMKGYREWSKQRLLRRLLEVEKRLEDSRRHAQPAQSCGRLDQGVQATLGEIRGFGMATEAVVSVGTITEKREEEEVLDLRKRLGQLEKEKEELHERLSSRDDELKQLRTENEEVERERWQGNARKELEQLRVRIQTLEDVRGEPELSCISPTTEQTHETSEGRAGLEEGEGEERDVGCKEEAAGGEEERGADSPTRTSENAALVIQTHWREHRNRDVVTLQSALRGHLLRESQLKEQLKPAQNKVFIKKETILELAPLLTPMEAADSSSASSAGEMDAVALTMIQSAFRGHLARCSLAVASSGVSVPSPVGDQLPSAASRKTRSKHKSKTGVAPSSNDGEEWGTQDNVNMVSSTYESAVTPTKGQTELHFHECGEAAAVESDDSDDIIVSPSRPLRSREVLIS